MPQCTTEGRFTAVCKSVEAVQRQFKDQPETNELKFNFVDAEENTGACYLDLSSSNYVQGGTDQGKTQMEATVATLEAYGINIANGQIANAAQLQGQEISVYGKTNNKGYLNFYLNKGGVEEKKVSLEQMQAMMGNTPPAQQVQQAAPAESHSNPFSLDDDDEKSPF